MANHRPGVAAGTALQSAIGHHPPGPAQAGYCRHSRTVIVEAEITTEGLRIGGDLITPTARALDTVLGTSYRELQIPLHGGDVRRIRVFDRMGFAYYLDETPPEVPSVLFVFFPQDAPFHVAHAFDGCMRVNIALVGVLQGDGD